MATTTTRPPTMADEDFSPECALAQRDGYEGMHGDCRQTADIPLPHGRGALLQRRCACTCHRGGRR